MTEEAINRACAELCGWKWFKVPKMVWDGKTSELVVFRYLASPATVAEWVRVGNDEPEIADGTEPELKYSGPNYCQDRNVLPELWAAIEKAEREHPKDNVLVRFNSMLEECVVRSLHSSGIDRQFWIFRMRTAEPRLHCEAALRAFGRWEE